MKFPSATAFILTTYVKPSIDVDVDTIVAVKSWPNTGFAVAGNKPVGSVFPIAVITPFSTVSVVSLVNTPDTRARLFIVNVLLNTKFFPLIVYLIATFAAFVALVFSEYELVTVTSWPLSLFWYATTAGSTAAPV